MSFITCLSISHRWASVDCIEKARLHDPAVSLCRLLAMGVSEAIALQTCNRVELYAVSDDPEILHRFAKEEELPPMRFISGDEALLHLLRLASGLDSMIIGEDQILGQLKGAYLMSEKYGAMGPVLSTAFLRAIDCGKRARRETRINKGCVSIGSAADRPGRVNTRRPEGEDNSRRWGGRDGHARGQGDGGKKLNGHIRGQQDL